jgi:hypothetical protein
VGLVARGCARVRVGGDQEAVAEVGEAAGQRVAVAAGLLAREGSDRPSARPGGAVGRGWRLAGLPRALEAARVRAQLDSCDRSTVAGSCRPSRKHCARSTSPANVVRFSWR